MEKGRRTFLRTAGAVLMGVGGIVTINMRRISNAAVLGTGAALDFKLGMVTYELGEDWEIETIIRNCEDTGFEAVEPRTGHKHGIELSLSKERRAEIRKRFENSRVRLLSLAWARFANSKQLNQQLSRKTFRKRAVGANWHTI